MATEPDWKKKTVIEEEFFNMKEKEYLIICYEKVEGEGPICWYGEQEYLFETEQEAKEFMNKRISVLGKRSEEFRLRDDDGPSEQYLVTYSVSCYKNTIPQHRFENKANSLYYILKSIASDNKLPF